MSSVLSLRQIRRRIRSVENTRKITRAMEMVAAAKLRRFQDFLESARAYTERLTRLVDRLLGELPSPYNHPFLEPAGVLPTDTLLGQGVRPKDASRSAALVLFTSDTGLCGTYNGALEEKAREWLRQNREKKAFLVFAGKHGAGSFHRNPAEVLATFSDLRVSRVDEILEGLRKTLETAFLEGKVSEVHVVYAHMESLARYHPRVERILPIPRPLPSAAPEAGDLIEPDAPAVLEKLLPAFFEARLRFIFYHALLTEQIARMTAMRQATQNAKEMIDELTLLRNKARQAAITKEIIEVVSGSRALKLK